MKYVPRQMEVEIQKLTNLENGSPAGVIVTISGDKKIHLSQTQFDLLFIEKPEPLVPVKTERCTKCGDWFVCSAWYVSSECWSCRTGQEKQK